MNVVFVSLCAVWLLTVSLIAVVYCFCTVSLIMDVSHPWSAVSVHLLLMVLAFCLCVCGSRAMSRTMRVVFVRRWLEVVDVVLFVRLTRGPKSRNELTTLIVVLEYFHTCFLTVVRACLSLAKRRLPWHPCC